MNITSNTNNWNIDYTGYFNGSPCRVWEGCDIEMSFGKMTTREMVESEDFNILERAGIEVHRDWRDFHPKSRGGFL